MRRSAGAVGELEMSIPRLQSVLAEISAIATRRRAAHPGELLGVIIEGLETDSDAEAMRYRELIAERRAIEQAAQGKAVNRADWTDEERRYYFGEEGAAA